ncbi:hypothetical protein BARBAKC583_1062 [Bartonella bacilliformis KC583]|uniref:Uncharacterized protein n=1 Tax=Bartonella bacilliformis (strain ATCC 35685 / KC583 / Herrer 020/F12,63) TaxID=360095 RepID=A1UTN1_BARBK|nr:hypothetical protein BARBAKC583_1062 [Bartonella bacilliformis KC583]
MAAFRLFLVYAFIWLKLTHTVRFKISGAFIKKLSNLFRLACMAI